MSFFCSIYPCISRFSGVLRILERTDHNLVSLPSIINARAPAPESFTAKFEKDRTEHRLLFLLRRVRALLQ